jgi:hypothetical protein
MTSFCAGCWGTAGGLCAPAVLRLTTTPGFRRPLRLFRASVGCAVPALVPHVVSTQLRCLGLFRAARSTLKETFAAPFWMPDEDAAELPHTIAQAGGRTWATLHILGGFRR